VTARVSSALAAVAVVVALGSAANARETDTGPRVAVLDLGEPSARRIVEQTLGALGARVLDDALVDAAVRGGGYEGSTNLERGEARRLAMACGAEAIVLGVVSVVDRAADGRPPTGDAFVALWLSDGTSGALLAYRSVAAAGDTRAVALARALGDVEARIRDWSDLVAAAGARRLGKTSDDPWDDDAVDFRAMPDGTAELVPPRFFRRPSPAFTEDADRMHAVATVDVVVQFNADGTYGPIEVVRWAGLGLDDAAVAAIRGATFWPARRHGKPVSAVALLRYNFRFRDR